MLNIYKFNYKIMNNILRINEKTLEFGATTPERLNYQEAMDWCNSQGDGFRAPTRAELILAFDAKIKGFKEKNYWSSTLNTSDACYMNFYYGYSSCNSKTDNYYVRCVREIEPKNSLKELVKALKLINKLYENQKNIL